MEHSQIGIAFIDTSSECHFRGQKYILLMQLSIGFCITKIHLAYAGRPSIYTMNTDERGHRQLKRRFWVIAILTLLVLATTTTTADILDTNHSESAFLGVLILPSMPGFVLYVLVTGDIHGWQPGPIGQAGRIIVTTLGSWIFWTPIVYWIYKRLKR